MSFSDWTKATSGNANFQLNAASPMDGVSNLEYYLTATANTPRAVAIIKPTTGTDGVISTYVRSVFKWYAGAFAGAQSPGFFANLQSSFASTGNAYWLNFSTNSQLTVYKGQIGNTGATILGSAMNLGLPVDDGAKRAFGMKVLCDTGASMAFIYVYWSGATAVGSAYNYSTMVQLGSIITDSSSPYLTSFGSGIYGCSSSGTGVSQRYGFDNTEILVP